MKIFIDNQSGEKIPVENSYLKKCIKTAVSECGKKFSDPYEMSILFVNKESICEMNREYRNINRATDVISFAFLEGEGAEFVPFFLGDIAVCPEVVRKHSEKYKVSFEIEVIFVIVHGVLHLLGYDHKNIREREEMRIKEDLIMRKLFADWNGRCEN